MLRKPTTNDDSLNRIILLGVCNNWVTPILICHCDRKPRMAILPIELLTPLSEMATTYRSILLFHH